MPRTRLSPPIRQTVDAMPDQTCNERIIWLCPWCRGRNYTWTETLEFTAPCLRCERVVEVRLPGIP